MAISAANNRHEHAFEDGETDTTGSLGESDFYFLPEGTHCQRKQAVVGLTKVRSIRAYGSANALEDMML